MPQESQKTQNVILANGLKPLRLGFENGNSSSECANSEKWRKWKQKFEIYCEANDLEKLEEKKKIAILLNAIGDEGLEIYDSFNVQRSTETLTTILQKFDNKFNACKNTTVERYNFFTRYQKEESLDDYVTILNNLAASCKFDNLKESLVKDMFIIGIKNEIIKEKLLQQENILDVNEAVTLAKTIELSGRRSKYIKEHEESSNVQQVKNFNTNSKRTQHNVARTKFRSQSRSKSVESKNRERRRSPSPAARTNFNNATCSRCGQIHRYRCPARGKICAICKKPNHFAQQCFHKVKEVPVTRVTEGAESSTFKQFFHNWDTVGAAQTYISETDAGYFSGDAEESAAVAKVIGKSASARGYMPDEGEGTLTVTRIAGEQEDITEVLEGTPMFYQTEAYVVKYQYANENGDDAYVIYWWIGKEASSDDKKAALELVTELECELDDTVTVVKVPQGKEPKHFLNIFKGNLVILFGGKENDYKPVNAKGSYEDDGTRLFRVEGTKLGVDMRAVQVPEKADILEDDDVFVLETADVVYVRNGQESTEYEREAALNFVKLFAVDKEVTVLEQGEESGAFWEALGGVPEEKEDPSAWRLEVNRRVTATRTLTTVAVSVTGKIKFEELPLTYKQDDLSDDGVYILDTGEELYLWQGKNIPERVKSARTQIVEEYIQDDGLDRTADSAIVVNVKQGQEPKVFRKLFPSWDADMWANQPSYEDIKNETKAANSK